MSRNILRLARRAVHCTSVASLALATPALASGGPMTFNADGVHLATPTVTSVGTDVTVDWSVTTRRAVTFRHLQLAIPVAGDAGHTSGVRINGTRSFSTRKSINPGTYTARVAYSRNGSSWVNGPAVTFTVKAPVAPPVTAPTAPGPAADSIVTADGVRLGAPRSVVSGTSVSTTWTVQTSQPVTFANLQLASPSGDAGWAPGTTVNGTRTVTTTRPLAAGRHNHRIAYQLSGGRWVEGPAETLTVPGSPTPAPAGIPTSSPPPSGGPTSSQPPSGGPTSSPPATGIPTPSQPATGTPTSGAPATDVGTSVPERGTVRPSGLLFDSGVHHQNSRATAKALTDVRGGTALDVITVFPGRESWSKLHSTWYLDTVPSDFAGTLAVSLPMWPENGSVDAAANGSYDAEWERMGRTIAARYPNAYVRIGWEMNLVNGWHVTPANKDRWITSFRRASVNLKKGGPDLRVVFNPNEGAGQTGIADAAEVWPGDAYVDVVGIDAYDWWPAYTSEAGWAAHRDGRYGWNYWLGFAKAHGKQFSVPEWGLAHGDSAKGGDNPLFIDYVYGWMRANASSMAYESYFNETDRYLQSDLVEQNPRARAAYGAWMNRLR